MVEILLYGEIGFDVRAVDVSEKVSAADGEDLTVRVNSPGGDVSEGLTIMNRLRDHPGKVTAVVEGLAASAASFIVAGGADHVVMRPHSELMVHDALSMVVGNQDELIAAADDLSGYSDTISKVYAEKSGGTSEEWRKKMKAETWYSAEEAVEAGLADVVEDGRKSKESKPEAFRRSPVLAKFRYAGREGAPAPSKIEEATVSVENKIARMLGMKNASEDEILAALKDRLPKALVEDDVTYPAVEIPAGDIKEVSPDDAIPEGAEFAASGPEGWDVDVDESTGAVTVSVPEGAAEGEETVTVTVTVDGESIEVGLVVTVVATEADDADGDSGSAGAENVIRLDRETYNDLVSAARLGWEANEKSKKQARAEQVDTWIREGRVNAARRGKVVAAMEKNEAEARDLYGAIPKNTIPVSPIGHDTDPEVSAEAEAEDLRSRGAGMFGKPRV